MTPSMDEIFVRPKAELSYQYWGSSDFVPSENLSARDNFAMLGRVRVSLPFACNRVSLSCGRFLTILEGYCVLLLSCHV